jgi:curved DNA-binding protein CbpA
MSAERSLYDILGLEKNCSKDDIKNAYRTLAKKHHPDKNNGEDELFKKISEAYSVLIDEQSRSTYDATGDISKVEITQRVINFLAHCIIPALKQSQNVVEADVVNATQMYLDKLCNDEEMEISSLDSQLERLTEAKKRFKLKEGSSIKENIFENMINDNIFNIEVMINAHENDIIFYQKCKEFLENFEYEVGSNKPLIELNND